MHQSPKPHSALMVGSVPLSSTEEVFRKIISALPGKLHSIPDGETGIRDFFIGWQGACFPAETKLLQFGGTVPTKEQESLHYTPDSILPTGYDDAAIASYAKFADLRERGIIPKNVRFQVCLPTPFNVVQGFVRRELFAQLEPLYERRLRDALVRIAGAIPAEDLAIQVDMPAEMASLEYELGRATELRYKPPFSPVKEGLLERVVRMCGDVPADVPLGFHLCYGDFRHKHFVEPVDAGLLVDLANHIIARVGAIHPVEYVHMPVPKGRTDAAYFEPLKDLRLNGARLYLGLVHANDEDGTWERIRIAQSVYQHPFGVATECGLGRTPKEELESILHILNTVTGSG